MTSETYDLLVIGSASAGHEAALAAAERHKRVALVEHTRRTVNGIPLPGGTVPVRLLRETLQQWTRVPQSPPAATGGNNETSPLDIVGAATRDYFSQITMDDLRRQLQQSVQHELDRVHGQLDRNAVDVFAGEARFLGPNEVEVVQPEGRPVLRAQFILIDCGARPRRPSCIPFDGEHVFDSDDILSLQAKPRSMIVVGGGVIGIEYALMFAELGVRVTVVDGRNRLLEFCDPGVVDALLDRAHCLGIVFRLDDEVIAIDRMMRAFRETEAPVLTPPHPGSVAPQSAPQTLPPVAAQLESGQRLRGDSVLYSVGRVGNTDHLNLAAVGIEPDERGRLWCNENLQTWMPHIYGAGDVVGYPPWARHFPNQGYRVVEHAFGRVMPARRLRVPGALRGRGTPVRSPSHTGASAPQSAPPPKRSTVQHAALPRQLH